MKTIYLTNIDKSQLEKLEYIITKTNDARLLKRCQTILQSNQGVGVSDIARFHRVSSQTVRDWIHRFEEQGINGLKKRRPPGREKKVNPHDESRFVRWVKEGPRAQGYNFTKWTLNKLRQHIKKELGYSLGIETIRRILHRNKIKLEKINQPTGDSGQSLEQMDAIIEGVNKIMDLTKSFSSEMQTVCNGLLSSLEYKQRKKLRGG